MCLTSAPQLGQSGHDARIRYRPRADDTRLVAVFLVLATLPLPMVGPLIANRALLEAAYLLAGFALKCVAALLLFTGESNRWFAE